MGVGFAVAATAALAQLGLAYGFGLLSWADAAPDSASSVIDYREHANQAWVAWFSAASCVVGGLASGVFGSRSEAAESPLVRLGAVLASAVGGFAAGPLVAVSAEQGAAFASFPSDPLLASGVGAAVGLVLTLIGLASRAVAVNVGASVALIWVLAILAVFVEVGEPTTPVVQLAVWGSWAGPDSALGQRGLSIAVPYLIGSALIGAIVAAMARRVPISNSGYRIAAASGIAGPLIVTVAHLVAGPSRVDNPESMAVVQLGPYAAIAGILGSLIVAAVPRSGGQIDDSAAPASPEPETERKDSTGIETAPGWTVPAAPESAFSDSRSGETEQIHGSAGVAETKSMPGGPDEAAPAESDPDVDWVQDLKPVGGGTLTADPEADRGTEDKTAEAKPKRRTKKTTKRARRRKLETPAEETPEQED